MNTEIPTSTHEFDPRRVDELEAKWESSFQDVSNVLYPNQQIGTPLDTLVQESQRRFEEQQNTKYIIGISAPGAAGKGTLKNFLAGELGYSQVVNTTTRNRREGEVDGVDYHFRNYEQFTTAQRLGHLALSMERVGRGWYGITNEEIAEKLEASTTGCIIEENPANLIELFKNSNKPEVQKVLLYILPGQPTVKSLIRRLDHRLSFETDPAKRIITPELFESTLGDRQIEEFVSMTQLKDRPDIAPVFIINDNLDETKSRLISLFGEQHAA